jgi:hypothetical protein
LAIALLAAAPSNEGVGSNVLPPCYIPTTVETAGWRTERLDARYAFMMPTSFARDSTGPRPRHGGSTWRDGRRELSRARGYWGENSFGKTTPVLVPGYSECVDTLDGVPFRIITTYNTGQSHFMAFAMPETTLNSPHMETLLACESPDSSDQRLFLAIIRTLRVAPTPKR